MQQVHRVPAIRASLSTPLADAKIYRPGGRVAGAMLLTPVLAACAGMGYYVYSARTVPLWVAAVPLGGVLLVPFFWLALKTVRVTPAGIAVGRPWQWWAEMPWAAVNGIEKRGLRLRLTAVDGARIAFTPALLHDGSSLRATVLDRISPDVLDPRLVEDAQRIAQAKPGPISGVLRARPSWVRRGGVALLTLVALATGVAAVLVLPPEGGIPLSVAAALCAVAGVNRFLWLSQRITLSETGISVMAFPSGRVQTLRWQDVVLFEHTPHERILQLRGARPIRCAGPWLMRPLDREAYRAFIQRFVRDRKVLEVPRFWL
jgi:hypothetical protein